MLVWFFIDFWVWCHIDGNVRWIHGLSVKCTTHHCRPYAPIEPPSVQTHALLSLQVDQIYGAASQHWNCHLLGFGGEALGRGAKKRLLFKNNLGSRITQLKKEGCLSQIIKPAGEMWQSPRRAAIWCSFPGNNSKKLAYSVFRRLLA